MGTTARRRGTLVCAVGLLLLLSPAPASAQNPFQALPSSPSQATPTTPTTTTTSSSSGAGDLSGNEQIGLIAAGILLIAGIAFLIRRDARAKAPVTTRASATAQRGTAQPRAKRVEQSRAKAKAGRKQRKRARRR
jgi:hypothetical protein